MNLKYKVKQKKDFFFNPTEITIYVGARQFVKDASGNDCEIVNIQSDLVEYTQKGKITETQNHQLPITVLSAFNGFDVTTMQPTVNMSVIKSILESFNLDLDEN